MVNFFTVLLLVANFRFLTMFAILGCLDKKSFINLCMKFSRYHSLRYAKPLEVATQLLCQFTFSKKAIHDFYHSSLSKKIFHDLD